MSVKKKERVTKARVLKICNHINNGDRPGIAAAKEGLGGQYLNALKESGIVYTDADGNWKAKSRIHDERYENFLNLRTTYNRSVEVKNPRVTQAVKPKRTRTVRVKKEVVVVKLTFWQRIKKQLFG
jgi:hypothetical protein